MATRNVNYDGIDMDAYNRWTEEFKVSSRYVQPRINLDRHYFDASVFALTRKKPVTFYYKIVTIVKSIF
jgi:hypothetical protein